MHSLKRVPHGSSATSKFSLAGHITGTPQPPLFSPQSLPSLQTLGLILLLPQIRGAAPLCAAQVPEARALGGLRPSGQLRWGGRRGAPGRRHKRGAGSRLQLPREGPGQRACWRAARAVFMLVGIRRRKRRSQSSGSTVPCAPARGVYSVPPAPPLCAESPARGGAGVRGGCLFVCAFRGPSPARGPLNTRCTQSSGPHPPPQRGALELHLAPHCRAGSRAPMAGAPRTAPSYGPNPFSSAVCVCGGCRSLGDLALPPALTLVQRSTFSKSHVPPPAGPSHLKFTGDQRECGY